MSKSGAYKVYYLYIYLTYVNLWGPQNNSNQFIFNVIRNMQLASFTMPILFRTVRPKSLQSLNLQSLGSVGKSVSWTTPGLARLGATISWERGCPASPKCTSRATSQNQSWGDDWLHHTRSGFLTVWDIPRPEKHPHCVCCAHRFHQFPEPFQIEPSFKASSCRPDCHSVSPRCS